MLIDAMKVNDKSNSLCNSSHHKICAQRFHLPNQLHASKSLSISSITDVQVSICELLHQTLKGM